MICSRCHSANTSELNCQVFKKKKKSYWQSTSENFLKMATTMKQNCYEVSSKYRHHTSCQYGDNRSTQREDTTLFQPCLSHVNTNQRYLQTTNQHIANSHETCAAAATFTGRSAKKVKRAHRKTPVWNSMYARMHAVFKYIHVPK